MTDKKVTVEFGEPYIEEETVGIFNSFEEWVQHLEEKVEKTKNDSTHINYKVLCSGKFVDYMKNAKGFMSAPCAKIGTEILEAKTRLFFTIDDLKNHLDLDKVYVYEIIDNSGIFVKEEYWDEALNLKFAEKEVPDYMYNEHETKYRIRYAEVS